MPCQILIPGTVNLCGESGNYCSDGCWARALSIDNALMRAQLCDIMAVLPVRYNIGFAGDIAVYTQTIIERMETEIEQLKLGIA